MGNVGDSQRLGGILNVGEERRSSARERGGGGEVEEEWERDGVSSDKGGSRRLLAAAPADHQPGWLIALTNANSTGNKQYSSSRYGMP